MHCLIQTIYQLDYRLERFTKKATACAVLLSNYLEILHLLFA